MTSREPQRQNQGSERIQNQQPGMARPPQFPPPPVYGGHQGQPAQPAQAAKAKDPSASFTVFRTGNFFVHAFSPRLRTGSLQKTGGDGTILERIRWTSAEKQRLITTQTRLLPQVDTFNTAQWREIPIPVWFEGLAVALALFLSLVLQALNLFNYPAYTADEGTFMANAWAILHGKAAAYAYNYAHTPLGWVQIAGWTQLTGGIASFGNAINSGRVLMLILAIASSLLLYLITSRLSGSRSAAFLAMILYSLSPLSLIYRHEVLIDNIGVFWLLLSLCLITTGKSRLGTFALAGAALGIAILSEGLFLLFVPTMLYAVSLHATRFQRKFSLVAFVYITLAIASAYVLLALLKGELFPTSVGTHPSLIGTFLQNIQTPVLNGEFGTAWHSWLQTDWLLLVVGTIAMFINILGGTVNRFQLLAALFAATFWIFLLLSKNLDTFSIVLLLPFLALNIAMALNTPLRWLTRRTGFDLARALLIFILIGVLIPTGIQGARPLLAQNLAEPQIQALVWIRDNVPHDAEIITNSYFYADLQDPSGKGVSNGKPFVHAQIYSEAALDPQIANVEWQGKWQKINFLVIDASMLKDIRDNKQYILLNEALHHAVLRMEFGSSKDGTHLQIYQVIPA